MRRLREEPERRVGVEAQKPSEAEEKAGEEDRGSSTEHGKSALQLLDEVKVVVGSVIDETSATRGFRVNQVFAQSLTELVVGYAGTLGGDLQAFAQHAGRKKIMVDDVLLACRRNPSLTEVLKGEVKEKGWSERKRGKKGD
mmetsp:Transcript_32609/g.84222  ORF Transcript_32609/g.84222 Transcript_32609/m.84222 type:complete len:141 (-) Transcript_32609:441-863(-)